MYWDHRVGLDSSPAQSHSTRHTHSAAIAVGHSRDGSERWEGHPKGNPDSRKVLSLGCCAASTILGPIASLPQSPGSWAQRPPGGAQQPETKQGRWGLGSAGSVLFQPSRLPSQGWLGEVPRPSTTTSSLGSPQPASESEYTETMETGGERGGGAQPDKGSKPHPRPLFLPPGAVL